LRPLRPKMGLERIESFEGNTLGVEKAVFSRPFDRGSCITATLGHLKITPTMGSWFSREREAAVELKLAGPFPDQATINLDWSDEASIHHRTQMNCLDNYALGKNVDLSMNVDERGNLRKSKKTGISLKFADQIEQTLSYECSASVRRRLKSTNHSYAAVS
jgi:hypothetical protein